MAIPRAHQSRCALSRWEYMCIHIIIGLEFFFVLETFTRFVVFAFISIDIIGQVRMDMYIGTWKNNTTLYGEQQRTSPSNR